MKDRAVRNYFCLSDNRWGGVEAKAGGVYNRISVLEARLEELKKLVGVKECGECHKEAITLNYVEDRMLPDKGYPVGTMSLRPFSVCDDCYASYKQKCLLAKKIAKNKKP